MSSKRCLVVLFGGRSAEHNVSCVSARHVIEAADPELYEVTPIGIDKSGEWHLAEKAIEDLKKTIEPEDADPSDILAKTETLAQVAQKLGEAMYKAQQEAAETNEADINDLNTSTSNDNPSNAGEESAKVVDADFEEVEDDSPKDKNS